MVNDVGGVGSDEGGALGAEEGVQDKGIGVNLLLEGASLMDGLEMYYCRPGNLACSSIFPIYNCHVCIRNRNPVADVHLALR